jgi:hypothetical protein
MKIISHIQTDHVDKLLKRARRAGRTSQRNYLVCQYLGSFDAKLHATLKAHGAMRPHRRPDLAKLVTIASGLDPWKGTNEPVRVHWKPKDTPPGHRTVLEFGIENRALQYLVRDVLIAVLELHPNQYATRGGVHAAIRHTKQALIDGYLWAAELDINDCYPSFDEEKLSSLLPLPKEVTDHVIISRYLNLPSGFSCIEDSLGDDHEGDAITPGANSAARRGTPQGSAASPIVAEAMVAIALKAVPPLGVIIAYADNVLLLAKTKSDRDSMTKALLAAFEAHPVGRLRLSPRTFAPGEPVEFLGHRLTLCKGGVRVEPDVDNKQKFEAEVKCELAYLNRTKSAAARRECLRRLEEYIQSWTASFKLCDDIEAFRSDWLARAQAQFKEAPKSASEKKNPMNNTVSKTFKLHADQKEIVEAALKHAKEKSGTAHDTVALELIAQQFMGTGLAFEDLESAMAAEYKKAGDLDEFLTKVATHVEEITGKSVQIVVGV